MPSVSDTYLTPKEAAEIYGLSVATLSAWRANKQGPPFLRIGPRLVRYRRSDFDRWVEEQNR